MKKNGFMLAEVIVATAILATAIGAYMSFYLSMKRQLKVSDFDYVALNLCREGIEWRESVNTDHWFTMRFYSKGGAYLVDWDEPGDSGTDPMASQEVTDWGGPFAGIDFEQAKLVPVSAPKSLEVYTTNMVYSGNIYEVYISVKWRDTPDGPIRKRELSTLPMSQVNDQLQLRVSQFKWENK